MELLLFACLLATSAATASGHQSSQDQDSYRNATFTKVVTRDIVRSTPAVVFIGKLNGELLRCLHEDPHQCELFYKTDSEIYSLLIVGEYIYVGLHSGGILRCDLDKKDSCKTLHTLKSATVVSLANVKEHLYVGLMNSTVLRCELYQDDSCRPIHDGEGQIWALTRIENYLYIGEENGKMTRCSLTEDNRCNVAHKLDSAIQGLVNMGNTILVATWDGRLRNCTHKSDDTIDCVSVNLNIKYFKSIELFNGVLYALQEFMGIRIYKWVNSSCEDYVTSADIISMAFAFRTYEMQEQYKNEDTTRKWPNSKFSLGVTYYNVQQRAMLEITVKNGKLYDSQGVLFDTSNADVRRSGPAAIFVMGPDGRLFLSNLHTKGLIHTSSLLAGNPVAGAGEMIVKNGVIEKITTCSDHYRPDLSLNQQVIESLHVQGYTDPIHLVRCCDCVDCGQFTPNDY